MSAPDERPAAELDAALAALVSEHASHGFAGFMRSAQDGCQVYVAATALQEALRLADGAVA
jgi:hypothetical protein